MVVTQLRGRRTRETILAFLKMHVNAYGFPPSIREISDEAGVSISAVHYHLQEMKKAGVIEITPGIARGIRVC